MADRRQIISTSYTAFTSSVSIKIKRCTIRSYKTTTKPVSCRSFVDLNALPVEYQSLGNSSGCLHHTLIDVGDDTFLHYIKYCIVLMIFISVLFLIRALTKFIVSCCEITSLHFWSFCAAKRQVQAVCLSIDKSWFYHSPTVRFLIALFWGLLPTVPTFHHFPLLSIL